MLSRLTQHRKPLSGVLLALMMLFTLYAGLNPAIQSYKDIWPSGLLAGMAAILLLPDTRTAQRIQLGVLVSVGIALLVFGINMGAIVDWSGLLSQNTGLLCMLCSVGLLKLIVTTGAAHEQKLPVGRKAFLHTLVSVTAFGSVINISAPIFIADRLSLNRPLDYFSAGTVVRAFSACSAWSPFFGGMAVVLTAVGDKHVLSLMMYGFPLTLMALVVLYVGGVLFTPEKLDAFSGYPIQLESFFVPLLLTLTVFTANQFFPVIPILTVISLSTILLALVVLVSRQGTTATLHRMIDYIRVDLPNMVSELQLFISAGILASGLQALVQIGTLSAPVDEFTGTTACLLLAALLVIASLGIHPVIIIVSVAPIVLAINPDPVLLGLTFLFGWSLGTCVSPLSGTNLIMQGRFGIVAWRGAMQNWPYVAVLYCFACVILMVHAHFH